jgi:hypothetical protein
MEGRGYLSGLLTRFRRRKLLQGRHVPSGLGTICSSEDHGDDNRQIIPAFSRFRNSASAVRSLSGSRRRSLAKTVQLLVSIEWRTPCNERGVALPSPTMDGKVPKRALTGGAIWHNGMGNFEGMAATAAVSGLRVEASNTRTDPPGGGCRQGNLFLGSAWQQQQG